MCRPRSSFPAKVTVRLFALLLTPLALLAQNVAPPAPVVLVTARTERGVEELALTGTVTARQTAALSPRASGLVAEVHVDAGDQVVAGQKLLSLDPALATLAVERAAAAREEARVGLAEAARLRDEARELLASQTIAPTEARTRDADFAAATATAARLEAEHGEALELLARHTLPAPFDGVVTRKLTDPGEWVATGTPVLQLVDLDRPRIDVQVPQERWSEISADTPVEIVLDARPDATAPGRVVARVPVSDPGTRAALVRIEPTDTSVRLLPGKSARVIFRLLSPEPVLAIPRDALVRRPDGTVNVWVARSEGAALVASPRRVDLGRAYGDLIEIRAGLEPDQQIIVRGNETLRDGQPIRADVPVSPVATPAS